MTAPDYNAFAAQKGMIMARYKLLATHHTGFTVGNLERTVALFQDLFGYRELMRGDKPAAVVKSVTGVNAPIKAAYLEGPGGHVVELFQYLGPKTKKKIRVRPCDTGFAHLSFTVDNVRAAVKAAEKAGLKRYGEIFNEDGVRVVYLRDPRENLSIEMMQFPK